MLFQVFKDSFPILAIYLFIQQFSIQYSFSSQIIVINNQVNMQSPIKQYNSFTHITPNDHPYRSLRLTPQSNEQLIQFQLTERQSDLSNIEPKSWNRTQIQKCEQKTYQNLSQFQTDFSCALGELEQKLAQQMLCLREDKLTLMEQLNNVTHIRQKTERQVKRLKRKIQSSNITKQSSFPLSEKGDSNTKDQIQCDQIQEQSQDLLMQKIDYLYRVNQYVGDCIREKERQITQDGNFETIMMQLRDKKRRLLQLLVSQSKQKQLEKYLLILMKSNHQLQIVLNLFLYQQKNKIQILRQKVQKDEQEKRQLLENVVKIKAESRLLKNENEEMRRAVSYFNL